MINSLKRASLITLGILSGFVFTILAVAAYLLGEINAPFLIILTIAFNLIMWGISPIITDLMMRFFYKMKFLSQKELKAQYPDVSSFLAHVCSKNNIKVPKIGIISSCKSSHLLKNKNGVYAWPNHHSEYSLSQWM